MGEKSCEHTQLIDQGGTLECVKCGQHWDYTKEGWSHFQRRPEVEPSCPYGRRYWDTQNDDACRMCVHRDYGCPLELNLEPKVE